MVLGIGFLSIQRDKNIIIQTEQEESGWYFSGADNPTDGKGSWEKEQSNKQEQELRILESVCVQHEIDHLNGISCIDKAIDTTIRRTEKKFGRNEIVMITDGKETKDLKWKKAKPLIDSGEWELYVGGPIT